MRMESSPGRHARAGGHPVIAAARDGIERPRRTGSSAFADDDGIIEKRPGLLPAFYFLAARPVKPDDVASVQRGALRRCRRPRLDQGVVVDGFALRLLVGELALRRDIAVLGRLREPVFS